MSRSAHWVLVATLICLLPPPSDARPPDDCDLPSSIGGATMLEDGTIYLDLIAITPDGIAEGRIIYEPGDAGYDEIVAYVGGIRPGESKPVPPWLPDHCSAKSPPPP